MFVCCSLGKGRFKQKSSWAIKYLQYLYYTLLEKCPYFHYQWKRRKLHLFWEKILLTSLMLFWPILLTWVMTWEKERQQALQDIVMEIQTEIAYLTKQEVNSTKYKSKLHLVIWRNIYGAILKWTSDNESEGKLIKHWFLLLDAFRNSWY